MIIQGTGTSVSPAVNARKDLMTISKEVELVSFRVW